MLETIQPGSRIHVKVAKKPTNEAAVKTIMRLLAKDEQVKAEHKRLAKARARNYDPRRRGGRMYGGQQVKLQPVKAEPGDRGTLTATVDVLRDLQSVSRFVEIEKA